MRTLTVPPHSLPPGLIAVATDHRLARQVRLASQSWTLRVLALTLVSAALRLYRLPDKSIWYDEAFSISLGQLPMLDLLQAVIRLDPHPPLYYALLHFWLRIGSDPFVVRLPSALLGALTIPLLYATGVRLVSRPAAFLAAALLTVAPFHVYWDQQARMYALLGFLCLGSTFFLVRALQDRRPIDGVAHAICAVAALYVQTGALFYLTAQAAATGMLLWRSVPARAAARLWIASQVAVVLLFVPWLPAMAYQSAIYGDPGYARTSLAALEGLVRDLVFAWVPFWRLPPTLAGPLVALLVIGVLAISARGLWAVRHGSGRLLGVLAVGPFGLLALVCCWQGILLPKSLLPATLPLYLLLSLGLLAVRRVWFVAGLLALVGLSLVGVARLYSLGPEEDWRGAVAYLAEASQPGDLILVDTSAGLMPLNYYLEREGLPRAVHGVPFRFWSARPPSLTEEDYEQAEDLIRARSDFWLLVFRVGFDADGQMLPYLRAHYTLAESHALTKIRLFHFVEPSTK